MLGGLTLRHVPEIWLAGGAEQVPGRLDPLDQVRRKGSRLDWMVSSRTERVAR
jgi:hypothetical protein